ncbi:helix-turn-helix transcriptional regulator [Streptomyces sp. NPDC046261]|uniref:helix-turn-helix transcriptional regulator n=1 Tax=Streptomyces sp. NPDC046261 TaxID=3157200 RepID=UPI0033F1F997
MPGRPGRRPAPAPHGGRRGPPPGADPLTGRERENVRLIARGLTDAKIGAQLLIPPGTATTHVADIQSTLRPGNRVGMAARARETGQLGTGAPRP